MTLRGPDLFAWAVEQVRDHVADFPEEAGKVEQENYVAALVAQAYLTGANDALHDEIRRIREEGLTQKRLQAERDLQFFKAVHGGR